MKPIKSLYKVNARGVINGVMVSFGNFYAVKESDVEALKSVVDFIRERNIHGFGISPNYCEVTKIVDNDDDGTITPRLVT